MAAPKAEDVFLAFFDAFYRMSLINQEIAGLGPSTDPSITLVKKKEAEEQIKEQMAFCSDVLNKYTDGRVKQIINRLKRNGDLK